MPIKALIFDLGGVLINFSHEKMCQNIAAYCELDPKTIQSHLFSNNLADDYERGVIDSQTLFKQFTDLAKKPLEFDTLMEAASDIFSPKEETPKLIDRCKQHRYTLVLLSNTCEPHFEKATRQFEFLKQFDHTILSYEVGVRKPDRKIYDQALKAANCSPQECFYVDDVSEYVNAARRYGIESHLYQGEEDLTLVLEKRGLL